MTHEERARSKQMMLNAVTRIASETEYTEVDISFRWSNGDLIAFGQTTIGASDGDGYLVRVSESDYSLDGFWVERSALLGLSEMLTKGE